MGEDGRLGVYTNQGEECRIWAGMYPGALLLKVDLQHELVRMQNLSPTPHLLNQNLVFNKIPSWFIHTLKLRNTALDF